MKIAVQTGGVEERLGLDGAYRLIREAGFDGVDANVDHLMTGQDYKARRIPAFFLGSDADCIAHFKPWKDAAEKYGLDNYQAHAPFPSYVLDPDHPDFNDALIVMLRKTIMGCDSIGCRNLVVHPFFLGYRDQMDPETEWRVNIERYSMLIPEAKKYGVTICLENMFSGYRGKLYNACCSDIPTDSMTRADLLPDDRYNLPNNERRRLALHFSRNLVDWCFAGLVAVGETEKASRHYASMAIDGEDLLVLSRSGDARARSAHDGNLITLHRVKKFRELVY